MTPALRCTVEACQLHGGRPDSVGFGPRPLIASHHASNCSRSGANSPEDGGIFCLATGQAPITRCLTALNSCGHAPLPETHEQGD